MDIVLVSDEETMNILKKDVRFIAADFFYVSDGAIQFEGRRIFNAYIDWFCYKDPNYIDCLERIQHSIKLAKVPGVMILI